MHWGNRLCEPSDLRAAPRTHTQRLTPLVATTWAWPPGAGRKRKQSAHTAAISHIVTIHNTHLQISLLKGSSHPIPGPTSRGLFPRGDARVSQILRRHQRHVESASPATLSGRSPCHQPAPLPPPCHPPVSTWLESSSTLLSAISRPKTFPLPLSLPRRSCPQLPLRRSR